MLFQYFLYMFSHRSALCARLRRRRLILWSRAPVPRATGTCASLKEATNGVLLDTVHFFRYNQMPEFDTAEHEERERLEEERRFGSALPGGGDKQSAALEPGATRFIVERFIPPAQGLLGARQ